MDVPPLFSFESVDVTVDGTVVLDHVDATIPAAGITAVVGPSGAGKSTLLRLCNRLEVPTRGRIRYRGQPLDELDPLVLRRQVGMVFQRPTLFGGTVSEDLAVAGPRSGPAHRSAVLEQVALDAAVLDREGDTLSGGEAQRVCLARALLTEPTALLLDEPTSALDAAPKLMFEATARALAANGLPIVWVSHELAQVARIAERAIVLVGGRVAAELDELASERSRAALRQLLEEGSVDA